MISREQNSIMPWLTAKRGLAATAVALLMVLTPALSQSSWKAIPLAERIEDAELVVIGQLREVQENYFSIRWHQASPPYENRYDIGNLHVEKVLKGSTDAPAVNFKCDHANQPTNPFRHMHRSYTEEQQGIWLLHRGDDGLFYVRRPDNFLPMESLGDVESALAARAAKTGSTPRIIVQQRGEPFNDTIAFIEGKEAQTRSVGRDRYEAVGKLLLTGKAASDITIPIAVESPGE